MTLKDIDEYITNLSNSNLEPPKTITMNETTAGCEGMQQNLATTAVPPPESKYYDKIRTINIRQLDHGYIVEVGCQAFAIESSYELAGLLAMYLAKPAETEKKYIEGKLFTK